MNFFDALNIHLAWKQRLREYVEGEGAERLDPAIVGNHHCCELGRWIAEESEARKDSPEFAAMCEQHAAFHRCAGLVVEHMQAGDVSTARDLLLTDYAVLSARVVKAITKLNRALESEAVAA
ncbi:MAG: CZB domain-containing protein [Hydrogenophaga sp.]|nr:CZB domain-containing protein [Gammaproteobacteria bacterium]